MKSNNKKMKTRSIKSKCACYAGGIGICLCIIFMSLGVIGITAVEISKNGNNMQRGGDMSSMSSMTAMLTTTTTTTNNANNFHNIIISFFSGFWGEVILLLSFASMNIGMWFSDNKKVILVSIPASIILYISMYVYYSIALQITGLVIMFFAYVVAFNYKVAKVAKLTQK